MIKIAIVYFKDPLKDMTGMDILRWHAISENFYKLGYDVDMVTMLGEDSEKNGVKIKNVRNVKWDSYDVIKTCSHTDIEYVNTHDFIISRVGRVVDEEKPEREEKIRKLRLACQKKIFDKSRYVSFTCIENKIRWQNIYGDKGPKILIVPTGCPEIIPSPRRNPFKHPRNVIYAGSLTSPRFVERINSIGRALKPYDIRLTFMGRNNLDFYGKGDEKLDTNYVDDLGCLPVEETWDYMFYANAGLAFARGTDVFDNEISKIYYYLRAGLPVVSEEYIANNDIINETGYGAIAKYGDDNDTVEKIIQIMENSNMDKESIKKFMVDNHTWKKRVEIYNQIIKEDLGLEK